MAGHKGFGGGFFVILGAGILVLVTVANGSFYARLSHLWTWFGSLGRATT